jgi:hypothetical protein
MRLFDATGLNSHVSSLWSGIDRRAAGDVQLRFRSHVRDHPLVEVAGVIGELRDAFLFGVTEGARWTLDSPTGRSSASTAAASSRASAPGIPTSSTSTSSSPTRAIDIRWTRTAGPIRRDVFGAETVGAVRKRSGAVVIRLTGNIVGSGRATPET